MVIIAMQLYGIIMKPLQSTQPSETVSSTPHQSFHHEPPKEMVEGKNDIHEGHCNPGYCSTAAWT